MAATETAEAILVVIRRLAKWAAWGLLGVVGVGIAIALALFGYEKWQSRPHVVTSLKSIAIGDKLADVIFRQGEFVVVVQPPTTVRKYADEIDYFNDKNRVQLSVRNEAVTSVAYRCKKDLDFSELNGVRCGASGDELFKRFGDRVRVLCRKNADELRKTTRVYDVVEFGTRYGLGLNKVEMLSISDKDELRTFVGLNWDPCK